jgi:hypothetical protein
VKKVGLAPAKAILGKLIDAQELTDGISPLPREEYSADEAEEYSAEEASFALCTLPDNGARENRAEISAVVDSGI